jgi:hypothetical protein
MKSKKLREVLVVDGCVMLWRIGFKYKAAVWQVLNHGSYPAGVVRYDTVAEGYNHSKPKELRSRLVRTSKSMYDPSHFVPAFITKHLD